MAMPSWESPFKKPNQRRYLRGTVAGAHRRNMSLFMVTWSVVTGTLLINYVHQRPFDGADKYLALFPRPPAFRNEEDFPTDPEEKLKIERQWLKRDSDYFSQLTKEWWERQLEHWESLPHKI